MLSKYFERGGPGRGKSLDRPQNGLGKSLVKQWPFIKVILSLVLGCLVFVGCTVQPNSPQVYGDSCLKARDINAGLDNNLARIEYGCPELPDEIYHSPRHNLNASSKILIKPFRSTDYTDGLGEYAAQSFYRYLLKKDFFQGTKIEVEASDIHKSCKNNGKITDNYDLIVAGDVLYYSEGGALQQSKVVMEMRVYGRKGDSFRLLWFVRNSEVGRCRTAIDLYLLRFPGISAPSAIKLIDICTRKFSNLFQTYSDESSVSTEIKGPRKF